MKYDGQIDIATGLSAQAKNWKNIRITWTELVSRLKEEHKTQETLKEFLAATKEEQSRIKDVGGYVGGYLEGGKRKSDTVKYRQLITLDIDFAHRDLWDDYQMLFGNAAVLHGTHKHCDTSPRFRLIMPLSRKCTPDEYVAIARKVAGTLGIDLFDRSTFETARLMFWPSNPRDVDYFFRFQDGPWLDADEVLSSYPDWTDSSLWPTADREIKEIKNGAKKQEDPSLKKGIIGAFCRTYSITDAIETFLSDVYSPTAFPDRYTYTKGTTSAGLIVYDDKFAYSHHGTDPCGGKLCNSFDLVRIHKFGDLDGDTDKGSTPKSFIAMEDLARKDKRVKKIIASENLQDAKYDFTEGSDVMETEEDLEWMQELEVDPKGGYKPIAQNLNLIFSHDSRLRGLFKQNDFDGKKYVFGTLPWRRVPYPEPVKNVDFAGVRNYVEIIYGIAAANKIEDSLELEFEKNHYHPILDYLKSLDWDGTPRIDNLLIHY